MTQPVEISLAALSPPPLVLTIEEGLRISIPAPGVRTVAEIYQIEDAIDVAARNSEADPDAFMAAQVRASDYLVAMMRKVDERVPEDLDLSLATILALIRSIVQGPSAAAAIQEAITGSGIVDETEREKRRAEKTAAEEGGGGAKTKKPRAPLASRKPSRRPSSASANGTTGDPSGGSTPDAPGPRSRSTSRTRSAG